MAAKETTVIEPHALAAALDRGLEEYKFLYIAAPTGWGKTTAVRWHFRLRRHTYVSLWDEDGLERVEKDASGLLLLDDYCLASRNAGSGCLTCSKHFRPAAMLCSSAAPPFPDGCCPSNSAVCWLLSRKRRLPWARRMWRG